MSQTSTATLGFATACTVLTAGRAAFFGDDTRDLPVRASQLLREDDRTPSFGFVGPRFAEHRVLFMGINPGNGARNDARTDDDNIMMPKLRTFAETPSPETWAGASAAYAKACVRWPVWKRHCAFIIGDRPLLGLDEIAYTNALPWRTASNAAFGDDIARNAARLFAKPFIEELKPKVIVALGKRANEILSHAGRLPDTKIFVWDRSQAATPNVVAGRKRMADEIRRYLAG